MIKWLGEVAKRNIECYMGNSSYTGMKVLIPLTFWGIIIVNLSEQSLDGREKARQNMLRGEKSPYLLHHADNPVEYYFI